MRRSLIVPRAALIALVPFVTAADTRAAFPVNAPEQDRQVFAFASHIGQVRAMVRICGGKSPREMMKIAQDIAQAHAAALRRYEHLGMACEAERKQEQVGFDETYAEHQRASSTPSCASFKAASSMLESQTAEQLHYDTGETVK